MKYWIQQADFGADDLEASSAASLVSAFQTHDWATELDYQAKRETSGEEWCPPGFGVIPGDGRLLHLCPESDGSIHCHYHYPVRRRLLGILPIDREATETWLDQSANAPRLIEMFVANQHQELLDHLRRVV